MTKELDNIEKLREFFSYNPLTGDITRNKDSGRWGRFKAGTKVGCLSKRGDKHTYLLVRFEKYLYFAHRLAWALYTKKWPTGKIDHIDCNPSNNKWDNLREATQQDNTRNQTPQKGKTSVYKGVCYDKRNRNWTAQSKISGKKYHLGSFASETDAATAYNIFAKRHFGDFANLNKIFESLS